MAIYGIGDLHFGNKNIIRYENRPFKSVEHMNETLIQNWNSEVSKDDTVFVFGDFFDGSKDEAKEILGRLNGHIILIAGNHDKDYLDFFRENGIEVYEYPILYNDFWIFSHEPKYVSFNAPYANIFAHVHGNPMYQTVSAHSYCVSAERIGYKPILLDIVFEAVLNFE